MTKDKKSIQNQFGDAWKKYNSLGKKKKIKLFASIQKYYKIDSSNNSIISILALIDVIKKNLKLLKQETVCLGKDNLLMFRFLDNHASFGASDFFGKFDNKKFSLFRIKRGSINLACKRGEKYIVKMVNLQDLDGETVEKLLDVLACLDPDSIGENDHKAFRARLENDEYRSQCASYPYMSFE